ncbi:adenylate/guanylate cyclase domain-containing protein [Aliifodinibius halophilus]|uniref:Adenylate/guanylate cyclase domain-containing protein n=1 Tax=Fodinibius halophilus TaxID=1736908 RepID=A0A6M1THE5_9BACT|nr:adenylate/guanylate cyclase domain-containing protein [Fodinibius halophilus]
MVTIDEKSLSYFNQNGMYWPWPREFYQITTDYLKKSGADLIVYDILFDTPDFDRRNISGTLSDKRFMQSLKRANNSILAFKSTAIQDSVATAVTRYPSLKHHQIAHEAPYHQPHLLTSRPINKFGNVAQGLGNTVMSGDEDGLIRSVHLFDSLAHKGFVPTLSMAAYLELQNEEHKLAWTDKGLQVGNTNIPLQENGDYLINWYQKGGVQKGTFPYYSFHAIVQSAIKKMRDSTATVSIPPSTFKDKIVIIGASAAGLGDIKSTPMSSLEPFPGMEIQATILNNLIGDNFITELPFWLKVTFLLLLCSGIPFAIAYTRPTNGAAVIVSFLLIILFTGLALFSYNRIWFPTGMFFVMGVIAYSGSAAYKYFAEEKQKKKIRSAFGQYVQPEFVKQLIAQPNLLKLGGEKKYLTVMFSDLAGFTTISESKPPEELVSFLNEYLGAMTNIIFEHSGTVDKYIGDAVMAFWGAPISQKNHAELACRSTIQMLEKVNQMTPQNTDTHARFGIASGEMIVGNIGSYNRFNYTVLGDTVNLAARMEAANKNYGSRAMISEHTYRQVKDKFLCRQLDMLVVKGKTKPVKVYELMADKESSKDFKKLEKAAQIYQKGLDSYYQRNWDDAISTFQDVTELLPDDGPSQLYIERCQKFKNNPPAKDWDGVFHLKTK